MSLPLLLFVMWQLIMQLGSCIYLANAGFNVFLNCHMFATIKIWSFANLMVLKQASQLHMYNRELPCFKVVIKSEH
jgi:hypothetical protein